MILNINDVVQFNENHKWAATLGIVKEIKNFRIMVGVPLPAQGTAFVYCAADDIERIGPAVLCFAEEEDE